MVSLTVYDGANVVDGNKIYIEHDGKGVFLDFGKNFSKYGLFYDEPLKNRDARGIHDLFYLNLIPKLNIYRPDLIPADLSINQYPSLNVAAVLLSHAHMGHCGNIGMLRKEIPIVASKESIVIMKGVQDTGTSSLETDLAYFSPRQQADDLGLYLSSIAGMSYQGRDFCCTEEPSEALISFLSRKPGQDGKRAKKLEPGTCSFYDNAAFPFEVSAHPVAHSIFGSTAYILRGETTIAYTGDFRMHDGNGDATPTFINKAKDASVLIIEGTRAGPYDDEERSEQSVCESCRESVESSSGLIIADFPADNFERLRTFQKIASLTGRELVVTAQDVYMLHNLQCIGKCSDPHELMIYNEVGDKGKRKWEQEVVRSLYGDRYIDHNSIRKNPGNYILCFSFSDLKNFFDIKPDGGTYIYSGCEAFNEEMEIEFIRLWYWLKRFNFKTYGFGYDDRRGLDFDKRYNAPGHASDMDITWAIDQIDPDFIVPIHTDSRDWFAKRFENVVLVEEGKRYELHQKLK